MSAVIVEVNQTNKDTFSKSNRRTLYLRTHKLLHQSNRANQKACAMFHTIAQIFIDKKFVKTDHKLTEELRYKDEAHYLILKTFQFGIFLENWTTKSQIPNYFTF